MLLTKNNTTISKTILKASILPAMLFLLVPYALAWEGTEIETNTPIAIESGNLVRTGEDIEVYNEETGEYKYVEVESVTESFGTVNVETYDYQTGEYKNLEMSK